ncbi:hypothetical protein VPNG_04473 [Cytospora leucostoma]|uniref:Ubiquinone biosynthesis O-methyltransferase, mitochondrial n=1 Tax=Cytospora leucostoma TaxID=1230097 RepID=A0A423XC10_9PEZI|nr:hypothetical protein VPNG_04473 [Cytospora leucostoma]
MAPSRAPSALLRQLRRARPNFTPANARAPAPRTAITCRKFHSSSDGNATTTTTTTSSASTSSSSAPSSSSAYSSVNPSEVAHFNALASSWWDPHGPSRILHLMNPLRHDFIRECHASQPDPLPAGHRARYLDVGCGGGIFAESAARLPATASVTAVDPTPEVLRIARAHAARDPSLRGRLDYVAGTIETLPPPRAGAGADAGADDRFDVVSLFEVIEHVDRPSQFLERCGEFVRPGGWLVMSTISRTWASWFTTNFVAEDVLGIVPKGTHDWNKYINESEMRNYFARKEGWSSPRVKGVVYVPGLGWREVPGSENVGNYFFAVRKDGPLR